MEELLRRGVVAAVGTLLRHRHGDPKPFPSQGGLLVDRRLTGFAGRGFVANVVVVMAHD